MPTSQRDYNKELAAGRRSLPPPAQATAAASHLLPATVELAGMTSDEDRASFRQQLERLGYCTVNCPGLDTKVDVQRLLAAGRRKQTNIFTGLYPHTVSLPARTQCTLRPGELQDTKYALTQFLQRLIGSDDLELLGDYDVCAPPGCEAQAWHMDYSRQLADEIERIQPGAKLYALLYAPSGRNFGVVPGSHLLPDQGMADCFHLGRNLQENLQHLGLRQVWNTHDPQVLSLQPGQAVLFANIWHRGEANPSVRETSYGAHWYVVPRAVAVRIRSGEVDLDQTQGVAVYTGARCCRSQLQLAHVTAKTGNQQPIDDDMEAIGHDMDAIGHDMDAIGHDMEADYDEPSLITAANAAVGLAMVQQPCGFPGEIQLPDGRRVKWGQLCRALRQLH